MKSIFFLFLFGILSQAQSVFGQIVPTPKQIIGHELGDKFTSHSQIEKYIFSLKDAVPERVQVFRYGESYEERALYIVVFSSPENLNRLDEIKANIQLLSDPRKIGNPQVEKIVKSFPAIVWLSYGVHGNEASCSEAALEVMYQLASRNDEEMKTLLQNLVIIVDPLLNPDGHERYVNFQVSRRGKKSVEDRNAIEHSEDWPSGRSNHYYFDLNRDWALLTQKETQYRVKVYQEWKPQVHADYHEMGYNSSYFFFPSFKPVNKNIPPSTEKWGEVFGKANSAAFDVKGWSYWSGEVFDLFYPGFGDSWPSLNGAIGMTFEQGGQVGVCIKRNDETILTLKDRVEHHVTTSFTTLKVASENREELLRDFYQFFKDAMNEGERGKIKTFIIDPTSHPSEAAKMVSVLRQQGIEVFQTQKEISVDGLKTYFLRKEFSKNFPIGSYLVLVNQPAKRLIMSLLEEEPEMSDTFFYDISSWALPVAYGVETYWTNKFISVPLVPVVDIQYPQGKVIGNKAVYAYVFKWNSNNAIKALAWFLQNDYKVHVAMREFTIEGEKFGRGSIVIPVHSNSKEIHEHVSDIAKRYGLNFYSAKSGYTEKGIDLGSDRVVRLKKPKIVVVTNSPVSSESFGEIWSMFDNQYGIDFVPMKLDRLRSTDLRDYTAIIFPDDGGNGQGYKSQLDSNAIQKIKTWVSSGGTFIGIEGGAVFASIGKIASVKVKEKKKGEDRSSGEDRRDTLSKEEKISEEELEKRMSVAERERKRRLEIIPGTVVRIKLDTSHPLGFGYDSIITVLKTTSIMFELSGSGYNVGIYSKSPRLSGYMSKENEKRLEDTPFLIHEQLGGGNIILFTDDPNFRLFWDSLNRLFLNSVLIMPSIRDVRMTVE